MATGLRPRDHLGPDHVAALSFCQRTTTVAAALVTAAALALTGCAAGEGTQNEAPAASGDWSYMEHFMLGSRGSALPAADETKGV